MLRLCSLNDDIFSYLFWVRGELHFALVRGYLGLRVSAHPYTGFARRSNWGFGNVYSQQLTTGRSRCGLGCPSTAVYHCHGLGHTTLRCSPDAVQRVCYAGQERQAVSESRGGICDAHECVSYYFLFRLELVTEWSGCFLGSSLYSHGRGYTTCSYTTSEAT